MFGIMVSQIIIDVEPHELPSEVKYNFNILLGTIKFQNSTTAKNSIFENMIIIGCIFWMEVGMVSI